ncbi:MAG: hypothetical protein J7M39_07390 [Anaerolineae bacterium]|nr:hypothetical protein [Anaerolineae bacterium]
MQSLKSQQIVADFFAQGYRVSGTFQFSTRLFADVIYDTNTNYLAIQQAYLSPITDPAKISAYYRTTTMNKASLDFILMIEQKDGLRRDQRYALGATSFDLCLTVPFFEIKGRLPSTRHAFDARAFLTREAGAFITLLDVTARCTFNPDVSYQGGAALIARSSISFLGEHQSTEE